ncbi:hypothetical protein F5050DRAFT_1714709 [Lentinula boryana]|uniref:Uncharacterized protein n=1 Tax=Lentinula boryana TaxID=40481 RepID=A0ABQ8Q3C0_9AGAR|nr:hypothetical protein F5050DRAFT_1714709 [Lentinula boryana]
MDSVNSASDAPANPPSNSSIDFLATPFPASESRPQTAVKALKSTKKPTPQYLAALILDAKDPDDQIIRNPRVRPGGTHASAKRSMRNVPKVPPSKRHSPSAAEQAVAQPGSGVAAEGESEDIGKLKRAGAPVPVGLEIRTDSQYEEFLRPIQAKQDAVEEEMVYYWKNRHWAFGHGSYKYLGYELDFADDEGDGEEQGNGETPPDGEARTEARHPLPSVEHSQELEGPPPSEPPRLRIHRRRKILDYDSDPDAWHGFKSERNQQNKVEEDAISDSDPESDWWQDSEREEEFVEDDTPLLEWLVKCEEEALASRVEVVQKKEEEDEPEFEFTPPTSPDQLTFQDRRRRPELVEDSDSDLDTFRKRFWKSRQRNRRSSSIPDPENGNLSNDCDQDQKEEANGDFVFKGSLALENGLENIWDYNSKQNRYAFTFNAPLPSVQTHQQVRRASKVKVHTTSVDSSHESESKVDKAEKRSPFDDILTCSSFPHLQARMNQAKPIRAVEQVVLSELSHQEKQAPVEKHAGQISLVDVAPALDADKGEEHFGESKLCPDSRVDEPSTPPVANETCEDIKEVQNKQAFAVLEIDASSFADDSSPIQRSTSGDAAAQEEEKIVHSGLLLASIPSTPPRPLSRTNLLSQSLSPLNTEIRLLNWVSDVSIPSYTCSSGDDIEVQSDHHSLPSSECSDATSPSPLALDEDNEFPDRHPLSDSNESESSSGEFWRYILHLSDEDSD